MSDIIEVISDDAPSTVIEVIERGLQGPPGEDGAGGVIVRETDGTPSASVTTLEFPNGSITIDGGKAIINAGSSLTVRELDGSPTGTATTLIVPNGSLSFSDGDATLSFVLTTDGRLTDSREWIAETVSQAEAELGIGTDRRAWTAQRVRQSTRVTPDFDPSGNIFTIGTGTTSQRIRLRRRFAGAGDFSQLSIDFSGDNCRIQTQHAGVTPNPLVLGTAGVDRVFLSATATQLGIGGAPTTRPLEIFAGTAGFRLQSSSAVSPPVYTEIARTFDFLTWQDSTSPFNTCTDLVANSNQFNNHSVRLFVHTSGTSAPVLHSVFHSSGRLLVGTDVDDGANRVQVNGTLATTGNITTSGVNFLANASATGTFDFTRTGDSSPLLRLDQFGSPTASRRVLVRGEGIVGQTDLGADRSSLSQYGIRVAQNIGFEFSSSTSSANIVVHRLIRDATAETIDSRCNNGFRSRNFANDADAPISCSNITANGFVRGLGNVIQAAQGFSRCEIGVVTADTPRAVFEHAGTVWQVDNQSGVFRWFLPGVVHMSLSAANGLSVPNRMDIGSAGTANQTLLNVAGYSLTGTNAQSMLSLAGTWNTTGTPTAIDLNITDTASNAASLLFNLRTGGTSRFSVRRDGLLTVNNDIISFGASSSVRLFTNSNLYISFEFGNGNSVPFGYRDCLFNRDAANTLHQRNGTNGQIARWAKTWTSLTNNEVIELDCAGNATTFDLAVCSGSAGGTNRGFRIGSKYGGATTLTPFVSFATNGQATFTSHVTSAFQSLSTDPSTIDIGSGLHRVVKNTTSGEVRDWVNDGGVMKKSPAYT